MAQSIFIRDRQMIYTTGVADGDTVTMNIAVPSDKVMRIRAEVFWSTTAPAFNGHMNQSNGHFTEYVVQNKNGTVTAPSASPSTANPNNSNTLVQGISVAGVQTDSMSVIASTWGISGTNAQLTCGPTTGDNGNDLAVKFDIMYVGST